MSNTILGISLANWTRDADGKYVDWTQPPYRQGGLLNLVLEGEDVSRLPLGELAKRNAEYMSLARRTLKRARPDGSRAHAVAP